jgi:signal transduction histidine kinase
VLNLIEDILDFSRIQFSNFDLNYSCFHIDEIIDEVFEIVEYQANDKNIKLIKEINESAEIKSDRKRLKQVLLNLVSNALKFTFQGSITVKVSYITENRY